MPRRSRRTSFHPLRAMATRCLGGALLAGAAATLPWQATAQVAPAPYGHDIAAGSLDRVLNGYARKAGILLVIDAAFTAGKQSPGLKGRYTVDEGLRVLLADQGLRAVRQANGSYRIEAAPPPAGSVARPAPPRRAPARPAEARMLDEVKVLGVAVGAGEYVARRSLTAGKTDAALVETPQAISVVTREQMDARAAITVTDAIGYTSGILAGTNGMQSSRFDSVFIRGFGGFASDSNFVSYIDGLKWPFPGRTSVQIDPYMLERVEVFHGPSSVLYGQANPGGFVNTVSKRPTREPLHELMLRGGSHDFREVGVDLGGPLDAGGRVSYRLTGLAHRSHTQLDYQKNERVLLAPSLAWQPDDDTSLTVLGSYQYDPQRADAGFLDAEGVLLPNPNGRLPTHTFGGEPGFDRFSRRQWTIGYLFEHRLGPVWTLRQNFRYGHMEDRIRAVYTNGFHPDKRVVDRYATAFDHDSNAYAVDSQAEARFATGEVSHTLLAGLDRQHLAARWELGSGDAEPLDLYAPAYRRPATPALTTRRDTPMTQTGVYLQDLMARGQWRLWLSGRYDWARSSDTSIDLAEGGRDKSRVDGQAFTGRVGVVRLFDNGLAPYASFATSFEPEGGSDYFRRPFEPTEGRQYELGVKYQPPGRQSFVTVALFDLTKRNVSALDPDPAHVDCDGPGSYCHVQAGQVRSRGIELEGQARLRRGLDLVASYSYLDMEVTRDTPDDAGFSLKGTRPVGAARHMASLWLDQHIDDGPLRGLGFGAGARYVGRTYATSTNAWDIAGYEGRPSRVPGYTLVDLHLGYDFARHGGAWDGLSLALNVSNLLDRTYVPAGSVDFYGERRRVLATLRYRW